MEKFRYSKQKQFCNRFLILKNKFVCLKFFQICNLKKIFSLFLFLFIQINFLQNFYSINFREIKNIKIIPEENILFTDQNVKFILEIPDVDPTYVFTDLHSSDDNVKFISSRKLEYFYSDDDNQILKNGTRIEYIYSFSKPGTFELSPLRVLVFGSEFYLNFEKVEVVENPKNVIPVIYVVLNNSKTIYKSIDSKNVSIPTFESMISKPIDFTIYVQYAALVKEFGYEIPQDSIFEEVKRYNFLTEKKANTKFDNKKNPVIKFSWTPLKAGTFSMPNVRFLLTAYNGRNIELGLPDCKIIIKENKHISSSTNLQNEQNNFSKLDYAFLPPVEEKNLIDEKIITQEDFYNIARLRSKEKNSFLFFSARKERINAEKKIGIITKKNESSIVIWTFVFVMCVAFFVISILLFVVKKKNPGIIFLCFAILNLFISIFFGISAHERHAIILGGSISPVPEDSALSTTAAAKGTCVVIKQETPHWFFVEYNENGGWIKKENLILIE